MPPMRKTGQNGLADNKDEKAPTPYDRNSQAKQASTSKTLDSTSAKKASNSKTNNHVIQMEQASSPETRVPPPPVMLQLNCIVGKDTSAITVKILSTENVGALKDEIKTRKDPELNNFAPDKLILYRVPDGGVTKKGLDKLTESSLKVLDEELQELSTYFPKNPARNLIHIVVKLPEKGPKRRFEDDEPDTSRKSPKYESQVTDSLVNTILQEIDKRIPKRHYEDYEPQTSRKAHKQNPWKEYQAVDGPVDLPPALISLIDKCDLFKPEPRDLFKQELDGKVAGDQVTLPSIGQEPKEFGKGFQGNSFIITEQMMEVWREFSADSKNSIKKVLAGPMGVGKSYLALFLAAKAYSEGWLLLYVSDAGPLVTESIGEQICSRFFALNKDILTAEDYNFILGSFPDSPSRREAAKFAADAILLKLLNRRDMKTLCIIDEHGKLFNGVDPYPCVFRPLVDIHAWDPARNGARLIFTGTARAGYETRFLTGDIDTMLEFVGPLSPEIFEKLIESSPISSTKTIKDEVVRVTNRVPRELVRLVDYIRKGTGEWKDLIGGYEKMREDFFYGAASGYFNNSLKSYEQNVQRHALSTMFRPHKDGALSHTVCDSRFMDLGQVYRFKDGASTMYRFLCPAAEKALIRVYKDMPLPDDILMALGSGDISGEKLEEAAFYYFVRNAEFQLQTTDISGKTKELLKFNICHNRVLTSPPSKIPSDTLIRCYENYERFDYIYNHTFFQISRSEFSKHNSGSANILNAFDDYSYPSINEAAKMAKEASEQNNGKKSRKKLGGSTSKKSNRVTRKKNDIAESSSNEASNEKEVEPIGESALDFSRNQIEYYLDTVYGDGHKAKIDSGHFVVSKDGKVLEDFKIVYICGQLKTPNHCKIIKEFPDILYVGGMELKTKIGTHV